MWHDYVINMREHPEEKKKHTDLVAEKVERDCDTGNPRRVLSLLNARRRGPHLPTTSYDCWQNIRTIIPYEIDTLESELIENDVMLSHVLFSSLTTRHL